MDGHQAAFFVGCLVPCAAAAYADVRRWAVPDRVTFPVALAGLTAAVLVGKVPEALLGMLAGGGVVFVVWALRGAGGGDVKLAAALGLWFGYPEVVLVVAAGVGAGGIWGLWKLFRAGRLGTWMKVLAVGVYLRVAYRARGALAFEKLSEGDPPSPTAVPFGACLAAAAWAVYLLKA